jgi:threonine dehydrogenase-like Zn-dependent dehydrogenase
VRAFGGAPVRGPEFAVEGLIIAVESVPERQELARAFGADEIVDYTKGDSVEQILELTGGEGVDGAIEAFGFPQTWDAAIRVTKPGGRVSNIGYHGENPEPLEVPLEPFGMGMADKQGRIISHAPPGAASGKRNSEKL